jgi:hypothetical protein
MTAQRAACSCGQLHLTIEGEPMRISMCHCLECQRRTGAVLSNQARFAREQITFAGTATEWTRTAASGNALTFRFCPVCGSTVYWTGEGFPNLPELIHRIDIGPRARDRAKLPVLSFVDHPVLAPMSATADQLERATAKRMEGMRDAHLLARRTRMTCSR